jgi:hypothetical protein
MQQFLRPVLLTAAAVLLLAGCATPAPNPAADDSDSLFDEPVATESAAPEEPEEESLVFTNPCALFTKEDAEALTGIPMQEGVEFLNASNPGCTYTSPPEGTTAQAEIGFADGAKKFYEVDVAIGHAFEDVPGIGDEAYIEPEGGTIFFVKDGIWCSVHIVRLNDPLENVEPLKTAAATIASRM